MSRVDDNDQQGTKALGDSETRFGPRSVPAEQRLDRPFSRKPQGPIREAAPRAARGLSLSTRIIVWGGVAAAAAAVTAGSIIALRRIAGDDQPARRSSVPARRAHSLAPRFDELDQAARDEIRGRVRAQARADSRQDAKDRAEAARRRNPPRRNAAVELTQTATGLAAGLNGLVDSVLSALDGFRSVAEQANQIVAEFATTAEQMRNLRPRDDAKDQRDDAAS